MLQFAAQVMGLHSINLPVEDILAIDSCSLADTKVCCTPNGVTK